jgi:hypothetical protein
MKALSKKCTSKAQCEGREGETKLDSSRSSRNMPGTRSSTALCSSILNPSLSFSLEKISKKNSNFKRRYSYNNKFDIQEILTRTIFFR